MPVKRKLVQLHELEHLLMGYALIDLAKRKRCLIVQRNRYESNEKCATFSLDLSDAV
jgi:hypothetical protein